MMIIYTKHAIRKFKELKKLGVKLSKKIIADTIRDPEHLDKESDYPKLIVSNSLDKEHIIRVVFKREGGKITVITFYPAKKGRYYEDKKS